MTNLSKRNRANKRRGSGWEVLLRTFIKGQGFFVERIARKGKKDIGDLVVIDDFGDHWIIEAKDVSTPKLSQWCAEAAAEADHYAEHAGIPRERVHWVVVWKRRQHGVERSYVVTELGEWAASL